MRHSFGKCKAIYFTIPKPVAHLIHAGTANDTQNTSHCLYKILGNNN